MSSSKRFLEKQIDYSEDYPWGDMAERYDAYKEEQMLKKDKLKDVLASLNKHLGQLKSVLDELDQHEE